MTEIVHNGTTYTSTVIGGKVVPVTVVSTERTLAASRTTAASPAATRCWQVTNWVSYGPSYAILMKFSQTASWCGNGSKISGTPGNGLSGNVTGTGQATFWRYDGVKGQTTVSFYNNWAYQIWGEGHFYQCPVIQFACVDDKYPTLTMNVYADGGWGAWQHA